ncbi:NAD(P)-dependent oxidoreductase [Stigmatella sp. ncwal1]|uniref:NAD(P)-dependent oxidoreductase n=1 Tax=Stigmatella ashevillensis TaxID=2995309 RepID=A0ABT5DFW0_9BACT|nr:NAD(P)-dependent oxidoreductase [Stigmatella ashevillena]MDC0712557.1 NAD(P)-dependent oxidoreductase [Stigmatella ashevillena]
MRIAFTSRTPEYRLFADRLAALLPAHQVLFLGSQVPADSEPLDAVVTAGGRIPRDVLQRSSLGFVQTIGTGFETVDVQAATELGVWVAHMRASATGNAESVAEHAILLLLALSRQLRTAEQGLRQREWAQPMGSALLGKVACVVGLGDIGTALAVRLQAFGMKVLGVRQDASKGGPPGVRVFGEGELHHALGEADCVVLAVRASARNENLMNEAALAAMKPGALLVNIARGSLLKPEALLAVLRSGHLAGAGLDVFWEEPVDPHHPLLQLPQVIATPHIAGVTDVNMTRSLERVASNLESYARGRRPEFLLNSPAQPRKPLT